MLRFSFTENQRFRQQERLDRRPFGRFTAMPPLSLIVKPPLPV
jgi:hypothetical protein